MKRKNKEHEVDMFEDKDLLQEDSELSTTDDSSEAIVLDLQPDDLYSSDINDLFSDIDDVKDLEGKCDGEINEDDALLNYKDFAMKKSSTKKVSSQNYDSADLHTDNQPIIVPSDCPVGDDYFNEKLEDDACKIIKGTTLDRYKDGRHIPIKDVVECFVKLADKWPDELVYCFTLMAEYGRVLRYKSLLDSIPNSYRTKMISQMSNNGASMVRALYKKEDTVVDIFC